MADDKKDEKKDEKKAAADGDGKKGGGMVPIIVALVALIGLAVGGGMYVVKVFTPAKADKPAATGGEDAHGAPGEHGGSADPHGAAADDAHGGLLATSAPLDVINLKGNITGSGGTRYVTLSVQIWVPTKDAEPLKQPGVVNLIQSKMEEQMKTYLFDDLNSPNIIPRMKKDFGQSVERLLRSIKPGRPIDQPFVKEIGITNLVTQ